MKAAKPWMFYILNGKLCEVVYSSRYDIKQLISILRTATMKTDNPYFSTPLSREV